MAGARRSSNKAKIARRVVEVLEFFDEDHPDATVMDIVRRYDRPQSSTSELLSSLVELGLLHKDPVSRSYRPTVRSALLGAATQSDVVRDGRLTQFMDRLLAQTGLPVLLFSRIGLETQIVSARSGRLPPARHGTALYGGMKEPLAHSAAGWLLLSTLEKNQREGTVRRLNAEAADTEKFNATAMLQQIEECAWRSVATGPVGFGSKDKIVAAILPCRPQNQPLVAAIVMERDNPRQVETLTQCLIDAAQRWLVDRDNAGIEKFSTAA